MGRLLPSLWVGVGLCSPGGGGAEAPVVADTLEEDGLGCEEVSGASVGGGGAQDRPQVLRA